MGAINEGKVDINGEEKTKWRCSVSWGGDSCVAQTAKMADVRRVR
jgi:hypothetical protein